MKQTAVEWLVSELKKYDSAGLKDQSNYVIEMPTHILTELEEQAQEMEKQQQGYSEEDIALAFNEGQAYSVRGKLVDGKEWLKAHKKEWFEQFKKK